VKELTAGSTIWLPVFVPGGLLVLGDCQAVVGNGAVEGPLIPKRPYLRLQDYSRSLFLLDIVHALTADLASLQPGRDHRPQRHRCAMRVAQGGLDLPHT
jgi:Acetamidase/Formamidase family